MTNTELADYDITGDIGPLWNLRHGVEVAIPMYSYERPAYMLWNAIGRRLRELGWTKARVATWLKSRDTRYALDGDLGNAIEALGRTYAERMAHEA